MGPLENIDKLLTDADWIVYPQGIDPNKFTLITSFSSERDQWMCSQCINIRDPQSRFTNWQMNTTGAELCRRISSCCPTPIKAGEEI